MAAKRLEDGSDYAEYDADGDGIVTDEELQTRHLPQRCDLHENVKQ